MSESDSDETYESYSSEDTSEESSDEELDVEYTVKWSDKHKQFNCPQFDGRDECGPRVPADISTPLEYARLFLTDEVVQLIVCETNRYYTDSCEETVR